MNRNVFKGLLYLLPCLSVACGDAPAKTGWRFRFAEPGLGQRAQLVETEIRRGGCDGEAVFATQVSPTRAGRAAPDLNAGRYGFRGRARDADCQWFAEGCAEAELPHKGTVEIVLDRSMFPFVDESCVPGEQVEEPVSADDGGVDANDAGPNAAPQDAGSAVPDAARPNPFDPSAPKCASLDPSVSACFDFASVLDDASDANNDAVSDAPPVFESALSGQALRVGGQRVAIADNASLNTGSFSVEIWLRPDSLVNLADQVNDVSLLVDKDQQYNVGFTARGGLRMQVYRGIEDSETTTADDALLRVGEFSYVVFTYDGVRSVLYKDGQRVDSENIGLALFAGNGGALHIGSGSPNTTRPFAGLIDALRISNVARNDLEICTSAGKTLNAQACN